MKYIPITILLIAFSILCYTIAAPMIKTHSVAGGQVWVKEYEVDNPFKDIESDTVIVLEVRGDYAQYIRYGDTHSIEKKWIPINARRIK